jgi:putative component of membrane protein insertase Oxa1/YidC/SpoIIIJ protein YidD
MTDKEILKAFEKSRKAEICKAVIRPKFTMYKELLQLVIAAAVLITVICLHLHFSGTVYTAVLCVTITLFVLSQTKNILLMLIFLYQKCAPKLIRSVCLFQPSCSEYMRLSLIKYGVFHGIRKGFNRLRRCRPPNGGFDEP